MLSIFYKILRRFMYYYKLIIVRDKFIIELNKWYKVNGDQTLRVNYPLTKDSIVLDIGGYQGNWANQIIKLYNPFIFIFEPIPQYYNLIVDRFNNNPKVRVYNFGLSNKTRYEKIAILEEGSSTFKYSDNNIEIMLRDIKDFLTIENIEKIDLIKINIEGGEYALLQHMLEEDIVAMCQDIQIQFHTFYPNAEPSRLNLRNQLEKTHFLTYDYPFIWENWSKKKD